MRDVRLFALGLTTAASLTVLTGFPTPSLAQTPAAAPPPKITALALKLKCDPVPLTDPFKGKLAGPELPSGIIPVSDADKATILSLDLPCQEKALPSGLEDVGLENLQRTFDFYSWRTFIALNAPADGKTTIDHSEANMPTRWEDMDNFKQLADVMLPVGTQEAIWPTDRTEMEKEKVRLMPDACRPLYKPGLMVVKMIEESFNEPFKTGPLIDQQGHYAIFDILMNRQMFDYIKLNHLNTKAGQMATPNTFAIDFPPGRNIDPKDPTVVADLGAFMLKVSWKILGPDEIKARNFHMVDALVSMPVREGSTQKPPCLPEKLGLIGFHAVHKTATRPQWIWTSFEHIQNVPDRNEVTARTFHGPYNFFSVNCKDNCPVENATPPRKFWQPDLTQKLEFGDPFRSQIVRETPLTDAASHMNDIFHDILKGTVWVNYMLLSTQWPSNFGCTNLHTDFLRQPDMTCSPAPTYFANSTLETYSQVESKDGIPVGVPMASSSCIACHGNAVSFQTGASNQNPGEVRFNQSDFTFILEKAK